ncbi:hypothetical protein PCANC_24005, partial [Puccinia coronata f. sp. avenae]
MNISPQCFAPRSWFQKLKLDLGPNSSILVLVPAAGCIQETNALDYFQVMYPTGQALGRTRMLVQDAMVYLVRKESTSLDLLRSWKSRLVNVLDDNPTGEVAATIAYAVYTLILKNHGKTDETGILSSILPQY